MIYALAYAAVALFCWGWWFAADMAEDWKRPDYRVVARCDCGWALVWPFGLPIVLLEKAINGGVFWHGWRLPYLERIWRK